MSLQMSLQVQVGMQVGNKFVVESASGLWNPNFNQAK